FVIDFGGPNIGRAVEAVAAYTQYHATRLRDEASAQTTVAGYNRRAEEWAHQRALAEAELAQIDKQIAAAEIRVAIAEAELASHERQIEQSRAVSDFLKDKFTNDQLYLWMQGELQSLY